MTTAPSRLLPAVAAVLLAGCLYPARNTGTGLEQLQASDQGMFRRCKQPLAQHLCAGADETAQAKCMQAQALTYARRSEKMRRRWLELNQCPGSVIDGPDEPMLAAEPKAEAPAPAAEPKAEEVPAPPPPVSPVVAAPTLLPSGASCPRSSACASDLCVRGVCVALAMIEIGKPVQAAVTTPVVVAAAAPAPAPAASVEESAPDEPAPAPEPLKKLPEPTPSAAQAQPEKKPAEPAAALERLPAGPRMAAGGAAPDQLRGAIVQHEAEMKRCVERQLKLVPDLRAEGTLVLEVSASGRVTQAALRGDRLQGTPLEVCMRAIATRWVFPRTSRAYAVEAPLKVSGVEDRRP